MGSFDSSPLLIRKPRPHLPLSDAGRVQAGVTPTPDSRVFVGVSGHAGILRGNTPPPPQLRRNAERWGDAVGRRGFSRKAGVVRKNEVSPGRLAYFAYFASFAPGSARRMRAGRPPVGRRSLSQPNRGVLGGNLRLGAGLRRAPCRKNSRPVGFCVCRWDQGPGHGFSIGLTVVAVWWRPWRSM